MPFLSLSRRRFVTLAASALLAVPLVAAAKGPATDAPHALKFNGKGLAQAKGKLKGPSDVVHNYTVDLKAGESCVLALDDGKSRVTYFNVFPPGAQQKETEGRTQSVLKANADGTYTIRVFMTQGAVLKGAASSYELTITKS
ncbi:hypothetical protein [Dokdonella sp.]|uniref:hypothetical protein n=1 Tax=Dokdonella sp. TaxID=2291710 RepID=UPI002F4090EA